MLPEIRNQNSGLRATIMISNSRFNLGMIVGLQSCVELAHQGSAIEVVLCNRMLGFGALVYGEIFSDMQENAT